MYNNFKLHASTVELAGALEVSQQAFGLQKVRREGNIVSFTVKTKKHLDAIKHVLEGYGLLSVVEDKSSKIQREITETEKRLESLRASLVQEQARHVAPKTTKATKTADKSQKATKKTVSAYTIQEVNSDTFKVYADNELVSVCGSKALAEQEVNRLKTRG